MPASWIILDAIILISAVIAATALTSAYMGSVTLINDVQRSRASIIADRASTSLLIIATDYISGKALLKVYVKNIGTNDIAGGNLRLSEVYLKSSTFLQVYTYSDGGEPGTWSYQVLNDVNSDGKWGRGETLLIIINLSSPLERGTYVLSLVLHNGVEAETVLSV